MAVSDYLTILTAEPLNARNEPKDASICTADNATSAIPVPVTQVASWDAYAAMLDAPIVSAE